MADAKKVEKPAEAGGKSKGKLILIIALVAIVMAVGGGAGAYFLLKGSAGAKDGQVAGADAKAGDGHGAETADAHGADAEEPHGEAVYVPFDPPFIVNFQSSDTEKPRARFLKLEVQGMMRGHGDEGGGGHGKGADNDVSRHMPMIRNALVMLFSRQKYDDLLTPEGKEKLRAEALATVQAVLEKETKKKTLEDIFFTTFVMQ